MVKVMLKIRYYNPRKKEFQQEMDEEMQGIPEIENIMFGVI